MTALLFTLAIVFSAGGLANVNAETTDITEINLTGNYQYGTVPAGVLPEFNPRTTTDSITIGLGNSGWSYYYGRNWRGFGGETPVAYNDGKTKYGYLFQVKPKEGYQLASSNLKVIYNGEDVTSTAEVSRWPWGAYVTVDLGKAIGENPTTYKVTFNSNGGTEIPPKEVVSGLKIKAPSTPTKDKYLFKGWYEDSTFSKKFDFNTPITGNITLYAKWEAANSINEVKLAGDYQYGTVPVGTLPSFNPRTMTDSITIDKGNSEWMYKKENGNWRGFGGNTPVAYNDGKTDYGYIFHVAPNDGYQLASSNLKVIYNGEDVTSTAEVSRWPWGAYVIVNLGKANGTPVVYTVTFNKNGGSGSMAAVTKNAGETYTLPACTFTAPTGKEFKAWEVNGAQKAVGDSITVNANTTVKAIWKQKQPVTYTVSFDKNGGDGSMPDVTKNAGETYVLPACAFTAPAGKEFKAWEVGGVEKAPNDSITVNANTTVKAIWKQKQPVTYTVSFDKNGGSGSMTPMTVTTGQSLMLPSCTFTPPAGKVFDKWEINGTKYDAGEAVNNIISDTVVKATWTTAKFTVTYVDENGQTIGTPQSVAYGQNAVPEQIPPKVGYNAVWDNDGTNVTQDLTIRPVYTLKTFTVKYMADGTLVSTQTVAYGQNATAPAIPPKPGYTATGWDNNGQNITSDRTINAVYTANANNVTFDPNGGDGSMPDVTKNTGETYVLPACAFTAPAGKEFKAWEVGGVEKAPNDSITVNANTTVKAIWKQKQPVTYTVSFDKNGGIGSMANVTKNAGETYVLPACAFTAPAGKEFKAWEVGGVEKAPNDSITVNANTTVKAIWKDKTVTVNTSVITIKLNSGKWADGTTAPKTYAVEVGKYFTLPEAPIRDGYTFLYWEGSRYNPGDKYKVTGADHTFTAVWEKNGVRNKKPPKTGVGTNTPINGIIAFFVTFVSASTFGFICINDNKRKNAKN